MKRFALWMLLAMALPVSLAACGDDDDDDDDATDTAGNDDDASDDDDDDDDDDSSGAKVEKEVTAAEGGKVEAEGVTLDFPAGALAEDTTITVETLSAAGLPDAEKIAGAVFEFGPDGTEFLKPVALTLEFDASTKPEGDYAAKVAVLEDGKWTTLATTVAGGKATTEIEHFSTYTIVWDLATGEQIGGLCDEYKDFTGCGGDIVGTWEIEIGCIAISNINGDDDDDDENPFAEICPTATFAVDVNISGETTFNSDKTWATSFTTSVSQRIVMPKSCFPLQGVIATCDEFNTQFAKGEADVVRDDDEVCELKGKEQNENTNESSGTWETDGNKLLLSDEEGPNENTIYYCVEGDDITVKQIPPPNDEGDVQEVVYKAKRKS